MNGLKKERKYFKRYTPLEFIEVIKSSNSMEEVLVKTGYKGRGSNERFYRFIEINNVDTSHFSTINRRTNTLNELLFKDLNNELAAYWLGFLMADGNVSRNNKDSYAITIQLQEKDKLHLENFLKDFGSNATVKTRKKNSMTIKGKTYNTQNSVTAAIFSKIIGEDLISLDCVPNKTQFGCKVSNKIPHNSLHHFIRGVFDGDGSIGIDRGHLTFNIVGSFEFLSQIQKIMMTELGLSETKITDRGHIHALYWKGNTNCYKIYEWLYHDSSRYLDRKYEKYIKHNLTRS